MWLLVCLIGTSCSSWHAARLYQDGTAALDQGDTAQAVHDLEEAARLAPGASEVRNHLGLAYWAAGNRSAARRSFEQAIALDCENRAARRNLRSISLEQGEEP